MIREDPLISIIILNYNSGKLLLQCVESIFKSGYKNCEVIVIDNASNDGSHKICKEKFPQILLKENKENLGYCEGNNVGIRESKGEFLVVLNPDTIVDKNWLKELINAYHHFGEGLYQPKLLTMDDNSKINSAGNMIQIFGFGYSRGRGELDVEKYNHPQLIGYPSGACLFTSKEVIKKIGYFEPFLFAYHDDLDLGWRAAKIGINSYYIPSALVYHKESFNFKWSSEKFFLLERNRHYCLLTHYSRRTFYKILPYLILVEIAILFYYLSKGLFKQKIRGYIDIIKKRKFIFTQYYEQEKKRKVTDIEIINRFSNELFVPEQVASGFINKSFNKFLLFMSKLARYSIQHA